MTNTLTLCPIAPETGLPADLRVRLAEAQDAVSQSLNPLVFEWHAVTTRFTEPGKIRLAARLWRRLFGIGGLTIEPDDPSARAH
ncbi:MAG: hypothetical protein AAGB15_15760 [Pseudomonadota bacterium]